MMVLIFFIFSLMSRKSTHVNTSEPCFTFFSSDSVTTVQRQYTSSIFDGKFPVRKFSHDQGKLDKQLYLLYK